MHYLRTMSESTKQVRWGVLGAAGIALRKVIPAMQRSPLTPVTAIASRDKSKAEEAARSRRDLVDAALHHGEHCLREGAFGPPRRRSADELLEREGVSGSVPTERT